MTNTPVKGDLFLSLLFIVVHKYSYDDVLCLIKAMTTAKSKNDFNRSDASTKIGLDICRYLDLILGDDMIFTNILDKILNILHNITDCYDENVKNGKACNCGKDCGDFNNFAIRFIEAKKETIIHFGLFNEL